MQDSNFDAMVGTWSGSGRFAKVDRTITSTVVISRAADGEAMLLEAKDDPPNRFAHSALWSWDARINGIVLIMAGNLNAGARLFRCSAWTEVRTICAADPGLKAAFALERFTFSRIDANTFEFAYEVSKDGSRWKQGDQQTFRRSSAHIRRQ